MRTGRSAIGILGCVAAMTAACGDSESAAGSTTGDGGSSATSAGDGGSTVGTTTTTSEVGASTIVSAASSIASSGTSTSDASTGSGDGGSSQGGGSAQGTGGGAGQGGGSAQGTGGGAGTGGSNACVEELQLFNDPDLNTCSNQGCCSQMTVCVDDFQACFDAGGFLDPSLPDGEALRDCLMGAECIPNFAYWCDSTLGFQDPTPAEEALAECISGSCCDSLDICTANGTDGDGCLDCLNGLDADFSRCQAFSDCSETECDAPLLFVPICDSGLGSGNAELAACLDANCCAAYQACTSDGDDVDACIACLQEPGGGALCNAAIDCEIANCSDIGAGGAGG